MTENIYEEVLTKKNFYFGIDENKASKNLKIFNIKAHGIKFRAP